MKVQVTALSSFEEKEDQFREQVLWRSLETCEEFYVWKVQKNVSKQLFSRTYVYLDQVQQLRQRFSNSIAPGGLAGDRRGVVPASGFLFSSQQIWKVIRENKDLDLPAHKVLFFPAMH
jgi:hypothetical protein